MKRRDFTIGLAASGIAAPPVTGQVSVQSPGVYIDELNAFPNSVVEVPTGIPAFVGYTQTALRAGTVLTNQPTRVTSMAEYEQFFGGPSQTMFDLNAPGTTFGATFVSGTRFLMHQSLRIFFGNGGGPCWIVSVGDYATDGIPTAKSALHFQSAWAALAQEPEPAIIVVPDAVLLSPDDYATVSNAALDHCARLQSRIAILDVFDGDKARTHDDTDIISGTNGFRRNIQSDAPSYGVAYYPWLNTSITRVAELDYSNLTPETRTALRDRIKTELSAERPISAKIAALLEALASATGGDIAPTHIALLQVSRIYQQAMTDILSAQNVMPPSAAMAGVFARIDSTFGVFKAPANTAIIDVLSPAVSITSQEQEDLNVPLDGKAVNAIRTFQGRGVLVWGARTLDGNSQDWRYVNVRRTLIMLEQSIKLATEAFVFAPNDASTWVAVRSMIENFLNNQWRAGALAGTKPQDAYGVRVGLGSTMTGNDILDGYMLVTVLVAMVRPAEFIVFTFQQKMQTS